MTPQILALIVVVVSFTLLFGWVFWPGNKQRFEDSGRAALELDASGTEASDKHSNVRHANVRHSNAQTGEDRR